MRNAKAHVGTPFEAPCDHGARDDSRITPKHLARPQDQGGRPDVARRAGEARHGRGELAGRHGIPRARLAVRSNRPGSGAGAAQATTAVAVLALADDIAAAEGWIISGTDSIRAYSSAGRSETRIIARFDHRGLLDATRWHGDTFAGTIARSGAEKFATLWEWLAPEVSGQSSVLSVVDPGWTGLDQFGEIGGAR